MTDHDDVGRIVSSAAMSHRSYAPYGTLGVMPHMDMTASKWGTSGRRDLGALQGLEMTVRRRIRIR